MQIEWSVVTWFRGISQITGKIAHLTMLKNPLQNYRIQIHTKIKLNFQNLIGFLFTIDTSLVKFSRQSDQIRSVVFT